jgi:hypothetical protein
MFSSTLESAVQRYPAASSSKWLVLTRIHARWHPGLWTSTVWWRPGASADWDLPGAWT